MTTTIAHYTDIVNIRHQITIRIINGTHRTRTTQNMIIEIIIHISRTLIISTNPTVRVIYLQCLSQLGTDFSCNSIAVIIFCSITHETFLRHIVSRKIISHLITTTTHADVMFLWGSRITIILFQPVYIIGGIVVVPLTTTTITPKSLSPVMKSYTNWRYSSV